MSASSAVSEPSAVVGGPGSSSATADEPKQSVKTGTYEVAATETIEAVAPGDVVIVSPKPNSVAMTPGLEIEVRSALNWNVKLEVNGDIVSDKIARITFRPSASSALTLGPAQIALARRRSGQTVKPDTPSKSM